MNRISSIQPSIKRVFILIVLAGSSLVSYKSTTAALTILFPHTKPRVLGTADKVPFPTPSPAPHPASGTDISLAIQKELEGTKGSYSIVVQDTDGNDIYIREPKKVYDSASLYKLWVMATVYDLIEKGELKTDQTLSRSIEALNRIYGIDPENAEQTEGTITKTVSEAVGQMITISHNYSAMLLTDKIKLSTVSEFLLEQDLTESKVGTSTQYHKSTAADITRFFKLLYNGKLANPEHTEDMIKLLKNQTLNEKLPKNLPPGTVVAHKTGELDTVSHDAGIVYTDAGDYIIAILTDTDTPANANTHIANISKIVYDYITGGT